MTDVATKPKGKTLTFKMRQVSDTKGALRYAEVLPNGELALAPNDPGANIGMLYIRKSAYDSGQWPIAINVTIESLD